MVRLVLIPVLVALLPVTNVTGGELDSGAAALDQALVDLAAGHRVVCLASRPDDVDWESLALLRRRFGARTTAVLISGETSSGLRAAAEYVDCGLRFLGFPDPGYSRESAEPLDAWGREKALALLVEEIRELRPLVLFTGRAADPGDGRTAAAEWLAREAVEAAASPKMPRAGTHWRVAKLFLGGKEKPRTPVPLTMADRLRGATYGQMGREARAWAGGSPREAADRVRMLRLVRSDVEGGEKSLLSGLPVPHRQWLAEDYRQTSRREILDRLLALREKTDTKGPPSHLVDRALAAALGVTVSLRPGEEPVAGEKVDVRVTVLNRSGRKVVVEKVSVTGGGLLEVGSVSLRTDGSILEPGTTTTFFIPVEIEDGELVGSRRECREASVLTVAARFRIEEKATVFTIGERIDLNPLPRFEWRIHSWDRLVLPVQGEEYLHLILVNRGSEAITGRPVVEFQGTDRLRARHPDTIIVPGGEEIVVRFYLDVLEGIDEGDVRIRIRYRDHVLTDTLRVIDVGAPGEFRFGVVETPGDTAFPALLAMGARPERLTDDELLTEDLFNYETIVLGLRSYEARPAVRRAAGRLLQYVRDGGNLVVLQCTPDGWSSEYAPGELEIGRERVVREDATLYRPDTDHRLLNFPNPIRDEEFGGWVRERGRFFPEAWDEDAYEVVLETSDPGLPLVPALLTMRCGSGWFTITALSLHLQLPELNPAALKLLANLVSYPIMR